VHRARWTIIERELRRTGGALIAGVDEVGRGSLAGPVVACAIVMPPDSRALRGVDDSKALTAPARLHLVSQIMQRAVSLGIGAASAREIDRINIYHASTLAMRRALSRLKVSPDHVLIDGRPIRALGVEHHGIVDGDDKCFSIACASIVAKVTRDRLMASLGRRHPHYAWEQNCGYATRRHIDALQSHGSCAHHRQSFVVKALVPGAIVLEIMESADAHHTASDFSDADMAL
jgi:ribonuclease HII